MTPNQLAKKFEQVAEDLAQTRVERVLVVAHDSLALIKRRITSKGETAGGGSFGRYSEKEVPYFYFENNDSNRNPKQQAKNMRKRVGNMASYKDWREEHGLQTKHKDFSFTNRMWQSTKPLLLSHNSTQTVVTVAPRTEKERKKMAANSQDSPILAVSKKEERLAKLAYYNSIKKVLEKHF